MARGLRIAGHPVHPALVHFPLTLLPLGIVCDIITRTTDDPSWAAMGFYALVAGLVFAVPAAIAGAFEFTTIPRNAPAKGVATMHALLNVVALTCFAVSAFMRQSPNTSPTNIMLFLQGVGLVIALASGALGGSLVFRHGIGTTGATTPDGVRVPTTGRGPVPIA